MKQYLELLSKIMVLGEDRPDRTGTGTRGLFGQQIRFDLQAGFPLVTTKKVNFRAIVTELMWFLRGDTNIKYLNEHGVHIWDEWADASGELGPVYGKQWRRWDKTGYGPIDQIANVIKALKESPYSRRHIVSAWNVADIHKMALPPCHTLFQFFVGERGLSCHLYARSIDSFLGLPFNIASYALLTSMIAYVCALKVNELIISFGDVHIYSNHFEQVREQLGREPRKLPRLLFNTLTDEFDRISADQVVLVGYDPHPSIKAEISV